MSWSEGDWNILCEMGAGVREGMSQCGLETYEDAERLCQLISSASGEPYAMDSLANFLCLASRSSDKRGCDLRWPSRPNPVTIAQDLGMVAIPMLWPRRPIEERVGTPGSRTVNDFSRFVRMRSLILCLDMETHFALRQCGRGTCLAGGFPQPLARDDQVYYWVTRFLHVDGPHAIELQRLGVSRGCLARTMACAWDWMDALKGTACVPRPLA